MRKLYFIIVAFLLFSCNQTEIRISNISGTKIGDYAALELAAYLPQTFENRQFSIDDSNNEADIQLVLSKQAQEMGIESVPTEKESFKIIQNNGKLLFISPSERGLLNATYALLEKLGHGFYISGDVAPKQKKWKGFDGWEIEDAPLTGDRFLFNWHNFLSGCTGWDLDNWQMWIDQANKMRYNGIMVHAYGNNPMFSFEYLGERKQTGYLNNTSSGRDWGNQHVNDVRRMVGGEIFDEPVFGAEASFVSEKEKDTKATELMQQVFQYAEDRGTKVIFALDLDTWMANPRNIIEKLPKEAVFEIDGHLTPNPDHPEGYWYYKQVLKSLLTMYPQIDQLSVWHRRPGQKWDSGTIWMKFPLEKFPENWIKEYKNVIANHPEIDDGLAASSMFAYSKIIKAVQRARKEIKPDLEISSGSWSFDYIKYANVFYPKDVPLLPLDWSVVFETQESKEILANAGKQRDIYPIIWAHHDDHRYIGRPYSPFEKLSDKLQERNAKGFGIIHWTTHPLDLYFTSSARQVWKNSANEPIRITVENYVNKIFGSNVKELLDYFYTWLTTGPMFGRETSDHFVDLGKQNLGHEMESWFEMKTKAEVRLEMLNANTSIHKNKYLQYQKAIEEFYISFFENQQLFDKSLEFFRNKKREMAIETIQKANPDEAIQKYVDATNILGFTSGEKAIVFSMNMRWKTDFINLKQQLGIEPVYYKFSPTQHDPLAQASGHYTYFVDEKGKWMRSFWENELGSEKLVVANDKTYLEISKDFLFDLTSIHSQLLPAGEYKIILEFIKEPQSVKIEILEDDKLLYIGSDKTIQFKNSGGYLKLKINSEVENIQLISISIYPK